MIRTFFCPSLNGPDPSFNPDPYEPSYPLGVVGIDIAGDEGGLKAGKYVWKKKWENFRKRKNGRWKEKN